MTEQEWLGGVSPVDMLSGWYRHISMMVLPPGWVAACNARRLRLFACELWKRDPAVGRTIAARAILMAEAWAAGKKNGLLYSGNSFHLLDADAMNAAVNAATNLEAHAASFLREIAGNPWRPIPDIVLAKITRDSFDAANVLTLAQAAYDKRLLIDTGRKTRKQVLAARRHAVTGGCCNRFADQMACDCLEMATLNEAGPLDNARLGVLADALEEAGCDNADILDHLRGPTCHRCQGRGVARQTRPTGSWTTEWYDGRCQICGGLGREQDTHVQGCWVLDMILGKA